MNFHKLNSLEKDIFHKICDTMKIDHYIACLFEQYIYQYIEEIEIIKHKTIIHKYHTRYGLKNGFYQSFYQNGNIREACHYTNDKIHGLYEKWNTDELKVEEIHFDNGIPFGTSKKWDKYGNLRQIITTTFKNNEKHILCEHWSCSGIKIKEYAFLNGKFDGSFISWYAFDGQMEKKCNYKNGKLHGLYQQWYENGQTERKCNYKNGKLHGLYQQWYENGQTERKCNYKNGKFISTMA